MQPGDRLICAFVAPQIVGSRFKRWPLHVTIVPWFRLKADSAQIATGLQLALSPLKSFKVRIGEEARFGPKRNRPAHLLEPGAFPELERRARSYLHKKRAWLVDETTKVRRAYRPHVTFQDDEHLNEGDTVFCDRLYIIEQKGDYKSVESEIYLG
jgi:2'-5' RNA ligase